MIYFIVFNINFRFDLLNGILKLLQYSFQINVEISRTRNSIVLKIPPKYSYWSYCQIEQIKAISIILLLRLRY